MARILGRLICIFFAFVVITGGANAYTLTSTEGHFVAEFPGEPKLEKRAGKTASGVTVNSSNWIFGSSDGTQVWAITMDIYSTSVTRNYAVNISDGVAASKGKLVSQKTIRQSGVEGREFLIDLGDSDEARARILWIGDRFYQIMFMGKTGTASTPDVDTFLNSFQATK